MDPAGSRQRARASDSAAQRTPSPETTSLGSPPSSNLQPDQRLQLTLWTTPGKDRQTGPLNKTMNR